TSSNRQNARSTAPTRRRTCLPPSKRHSPSTSPSKAPTRPTRRDSWKSPAATASGPRSPGATRGFRAGKANLPLDWETVCRIYIIVTYILEGLMQVAKWGNSLAVRLPRSVVDALELKEGDSIQIQVAGARTFEIEKSPSPRQLLQRLRKFRGRLPADFRFDRLEANARG